MAVSTIRFRASWFDGQSAQKHAVQVLPARDHLVVQLEDGTEVRWKYTSIRLVEHTGAGPVRLEHEVEGPPSPRVETLVVEDARFLPRVYALDPCAFRSGLDRLLHPGMKRLLIVAAVLFFPMMAVFLWQAVVPFVSNVVAARLPVSWEEKLGEAAVESLLGQKPRPPEPPVKEALDVITRRLLSTLPDQPYHFKIYVAPRPLVNAVAFPGGIVVVFQGLLNATQTPEELAGVLAHEFQHVLKRHATRKMARDFTLSIIISLIAGNTDTLMMVLQTASQLESLNYSRELETEADRGGMEMMLAAKLDPQGMVRAYEMLDAEEKKMIRAFSPKPGGKKNGPGLKNENKEGADEKEGQGGEGVKTPEWMRWLSTHPAGEERLKLLREMAKTASTEPVPLLEDMDWNLMHREIKTTPQHPG